jgi:IS5 family transposase
MANRESQYVRVARLAYALTQHALPTYSHLHSPHLYTLPQLAACVLLAFYCNKSYRDTEEWLLATDQVCAALELTRVPDHSTLCRMFQRLGLNRLHRMLDRLVTALAPEERIIAGDSTGYRLSNASRYFETRTHRAHRDWFRGAYAVGTDSQLILLARQTHGGSLSDIRFLKPLRHAGARYGVPGWVFVADKGFDCRAVTGRDLIPPIRKRGQLKAATRQARAELVSQARLDGIYGQRWKCETVHSVIKRKFGDTIRSRRLARQRCEPLVKALIYDLHR